MKSKREKHKRMVLARRHERSVGESEQRITKQSERTTNVRG